MNTVLIWALPALVVGALAGFLAKHLIGRQTVNSAEGKARDLVRKAAEREKELELDAKAQALKIIEEAKRESESQRAELTRLRTRLENREEVFDKKLLEFENERQALATRSAELEAMKGKIAELEAQAVKKLEEVAGLPREQAKEQLLAELERTFKEDIAGRVKKIQKLGTEEVEREARTILSAAIQRCASAHSAETTTTTVAIPSDEMKGRIIGREGRNIKTIEQLTGVEIIVDETPETIVISGFNPLRRHLAKRALDRLMQDGRIHPGRIEEAVEEAKKALAVDIREAGEEAAFEAGVGGLHPKLLALLGRLKYRTSYGQNVLRHSIEVSLLSRMLAEELGANTAIAKKGGLLHDIGKAVDHEVQGGHPQIGYDIMKKFGLPEEVAYISIGHHEDLPTSLEAVIVRAADAISGARPGARKDTYEQYVRRLEELESVATSFPGIAKSYAIQAGREIRIFVVPEQVDDIAAVKLARDIADKIQTELTYPGEIKVTLIREKRVTEYAR